MRQNQSVVHSSTYQIVWCTKYRKEILVEEISNDLRSIIEALAKEKDVVVYEFDIQPEHVYLKVDIHPQYGVGEFVKNAKGRTARVLRSSYPRLKRVVPSLWTQSYFVATGDRDFSEQIAEYISRQKLRGEK